MSGLIWILTVCHSDGIPERVFPNSEFLKKSAGKKTHENIPSVQRVNIGFSAAKLFSLFFFSSFFLPFFLTNENVKKTAYFN